jgi:multiple sugar transport system ATP-binding protein
VSAGNVGGRDPNHLYHAPGNRFVAGFIGSPRMNFLSAVVAAVAREGVLVRYETGEAQRVAVEPGRAHIGERVTVAIRPEHLDAQAAEHGVAARTTAVESLGDAAYLYAESPVAPDGLVARIAPLERHDRGEVLKLGAAPEHCHLFDEAGRAFERRIVEVLSAA